jgi:hypothetical protein
MTTVRRYLHRCVAAIGSGSDLNRRDTFAGAADAVPTPVQRFAV